MAGPNTTSPSSGARRSGTTSPKSPQASQSPKSASEDGHTFAAQQEGVIQPGENLDDDDGDSAVGSEDNQSSTNSLSESIYKYRVFHGRTYNASKTSEYWAPNDEQQNEGLDMWHNSLLMMMDNKLFLAPIGDNVQRVLDVGTGTGIWAIDFGDMYPSAEVIGTDLSPIQPSWVPPNVHFQIDDCILDWTWPENYFDFIHIRNLYGSIPDWDDLYSKAYRHCKPGGWIQNLEPEVRLQSDQMKFPDDHIYNVWAENFYNAADMSGRTFRIACEHRMLEGIQKAGFEDVREVKVKLPCHGWPRDPALQQAGLLFFSVLDNSLEGFGMMLFAQQFGWSPEEVTVFCAKMRAEVKKRSNCAWLQVTIVYGRKPESAA